MIENTIIECTRCINPVPLKLKKIKHIPDLIHIEVCPNCETELASIGNGHSMQDQKWLIRTHVCRILKQATNQKFIMSSGDFTDLDVQRYQSDAWLDAQKDAL
jgi:hypothetical protein|tara:strand:+ start:703 stop:1011 length:309 start_codon:yes stop_codon:yes gene_type:complete